METTNQARVEISAIITRVDGKIEDLGVLSNQSLSTRVANKIRTLIRKA